MKRRARRAFTLLEIVIALALLSLIGTLVGVQTVQLLRTHRFASEIEQFFTSVREAQVLALNYTTDHAIDISLENGIVYYQITTDEPFSPQVLDQRKIACKQISQIFFDQRKEKKLHFAILSSGSIEPQGVLALCSEQERRYIDLRGGTLVKCTATKPALNKLKIPEER
jgi:prepilin-type N-terminal cleavage/methylation domain-containing protein